jgi:flavin-binding protein dodecin
MDRRGFLGAFMAAAAALAGGGAATAALAPAAKTLRKLPGVAVTANTKPLTDALEDSRQMLRRLINECRVVSWTHEASVGDLPIYRVTFRHAPGDAPDILRQDVAHAIEQGHICDATVHCYQDEVDVFHLGDYRTVEPAGSKRYEVVVSYIVTGAA